MDKPEDSLKVGVIASFAEAARGLHTVLEYLGEDTRREGLLRTPERHIEYLTEFCSPPEFEFTTFANEGYDQMILQTNIPFVSLCEHHLLPFFGEATIAYLPGDRIVGLSKLARVVEKFSRRLQNQERVTTQIAEFLEKNLQPRGVAVALRARHLCMEFRGVKKSNTWTITNYLGGPFRVGDARNEFLSLGNIAIK